MKKLFLTAAVASFFIACDKKTEDTVTAQTTATETTTTVVDSTQTTAAPAPETIETTTTASQNDSAAEISTAHYEGDGKHVVATYMGDQAGTMSVKIKVDDKEYVLPQKEAWAKGAIYSDGTVEFTNKGQINEAELKMEGKTYKMKEKK